MNTIFLFIKETVVSGINAATYYPSVTEAEGENASETGVGAGGAGRAVLWLLQGKTNLNSSLNRPAY